MSVSTDTGGAATGAATWTIRTGAGGAGGAGSRKGVGATGRGGGYGGRSDVTAAGRQGGSGSREHRGGAIARTVNLNGRNYQRHGSRGLHGEKGGKKVKCQDEHLNNCRSSLSNGYKKEKETPSTNG
eukprot:COSAG02_NODE_16433_length_1083_cov_3.856707_2_plen_127_part_00